MGWYSNRVRGERAKKALPQAGVVLPSPGEEPANEFAARAKAAWARLIRKVYEADPLECPKDGGRALSSLPGNRPMRVIALIEEPEIIQRILEHLELWALEPAERSPPLDPASWPRHASLPLTYHPVNSLITGGSIEILKNRISEGVFERSFSQRPDKE